MQSQVRFNRVSEKVLKKVWEALVQSQVRFNRVSEEVGEGSLGAKPSQVQGSGEGVQRRSGRLWCSQVRFNRVPEKVPVKVCSIGLRRSFRRRCRRLWHRARSGSTGFRRRRSGRLWYKARSGSTGFRNRFWRRFREALAQSQVKFNRVPKKVPKKVPEKVLEKVLEKVPEGFGAKPGQVQQGSGEVSGEGRGGFGAVPGQVQQGSGEGSGEGSGQGLGGFGAARSGSTGFRRMFQRLASRHASDRFVKISRCGCWGYHRSLYFSGY